jgi:addiction module RelE/StbE family toxin
MNKIVLSPSFKNSYKKFVKKFSYLQNKIDESIRLLEEDIFHPKLHTHKLSGELLGCLACSCGYDCKIVFKVEVEKITNNTIILLITIGTHEEVY